MKGKKTGGRQKGTPNKSTATNREWLTAFLSGNREKFEKEFNSLSGRDFVILYEKMFAYITPKVTIESIDINKLTDSDLDEFCNKVTERLSD